MENKVSISVFILFLGFSSVLFSEAVPLSRSLKSFSADVAVQSLIAQGEIMRTRGKLSIEGRMDIEIADYSGPGANNDHDPNAPSKV